MNLVMGFIFQNGGSIFIELAPDCGRLILKGEKLSARRLQRNKKNSKLN